MQPQQELHMPTTDVIERTRDAFPLAGFLASRPLENCNPNSAAAAFIARNGCMSQMLCGQQSESMCDWTRHSFAFQAMAKPRLQRSQRPSCSLSKHCDSSLTASHWESLISIHWPFDSHKEARAQNVVLDPGPTALYLRSGFRLYGRYSPLQCRP